MMEFGKKPVTPTKSPANSTKKLTISFNGELFKFCFSLEARKPGPTLPEGYERETWQMLQAAVIAVQKKESINTSKEELYKVVSSLFVLCTYA